MFIDVGIQVLLTLKFNTQATQQTQDKNIIMYTNITDAMVIHVNLMVITLSL